LIAAELSKPILNPLSSFAGSFLEPLFALPNSTAVKMLRRVLGHTESINDSVPYLCEVCNRITLKALGIYRTDTKAVTIDPDGRQIFSEELRMDCEFCMLLVDGDSVPELRSFGENGLKITLLSEFPHEVNEGGIYDGKAAQRRVQILSILANTPVEAAGQIAYINARYQGWMKEERTRLRFERKLFVFTAEGIPEPDNSRSRENK
jgi:hypothetical protein